ncbi:uncharacterized protein At4g14100-like [Miscanthus floridulus]|uniref:uncharacterized protein At4g14100-like n=1 Tax=Miscanthus floridulus TaxID=154761 RepID=UPI00345B025D
MSPLQLLPLLLIAAGNAKTTPPSVAAAAPAAEAGDGHHHSPPVPATPPWPEQYHAVVITNQTARGGRLQQIDIYYDWPRGRGLNVIRDQLDSGGEPLWDVQWANGTSFLFDSASCTTFQYPVGLLPPEWKARGGAAYLGRDRVDGFDCHVWSNFLFARYYEDAATGRPVSWTVVNGTGMQRHVLSFEVGGVPQDPTKWQAPPYCFNGSSTDGAAAASP